MLQNNSIINEDTIGELDFANEIRFSETCSPELSDELHPVEESLISRPKLFRQFREIRQLYESGAKFVSFDTETTGLHGEKDFLLELGAVSFSKSEPYSPECQVQLFNKLIKPPVSIPDYITKINSIDDEMVKDASVASEVLAEFTHFIGKNTVLIAHNASFDIKFVNAALVRAKMAQLSNTVIDTLQLARWAYPKLVYETEKGQYKLQSLARRFNIEVKNAHRAQDDARVCMELFLKILSDTAGIQKASK